MLLRAFAKINLDLRILGHRPDGYHEVRTILQTIDWSDEIRIEPADRLEFVVHGASGDGLSAGDGIPDDESNLVLRAVREFERFTGEPVRARIELVKNVPSGAGLGGGSADAAVTMMGLMRMTGRDIPDSDRRMCMSRLGSDVPFFALGGRALGTGRGDEVAPLEDEAPYWLVIVHPGVPVSTAEAYSWLTVRDKSNTIGGFGGQFVPGYEIGEPGNDFEDVVFGRHPALAGIKAGLLQSGARRAALSGSGSAIFAVFDSEFRAARAASELAGRGIVKVTRPLMRAGYLQRVFGS